MTRVVIARLRSQLAGCHDARVTSVIRPGVAAGHPAPPRRAPTSSSEGGNAVDAAVAMMLVSCAAETIFTGLGGGGFATVYDAAEPAGPLRRLLRHACQGWAASSQAAGWRSR